MHITAIMNYKGGVGKTTTAVNLSFELAALGYRVLLVDMAPQQDAAYILRGRAKTKRNLNNCLRERRLLHGAAGVAYSASIPYKHAKVRGYLRDDTPAKGRLDLLCAKVPDEIDADPLNLRAVLNGDGGNDYDYAVIDTDPGLNSMTVSALVAADDVIVPIAPARLSLNALDKLHNYIAEALDFNPGLKILAVLVTMFAGTKQQVRLLADFIGSSPVPVFDTCISYDKKVDSSHDIRKPLYKHCSKRKVTDDYRALAKEYVDRTGKERDGWEA